jgi:hypothetical protein
MTESERGVVNSLIDKVFRTMPPAFLLLLLLNVVFLLAALYVLNHNVDQRNAMLMKIVENCLLKKGD